MGFFDSITSGISSAWNSVKSVGSRVVNGIGDAGKSVFNWGKENIPKAASSVGTWITGAWNNEVKPAITTVYNDVKSASSKAIDGITSFEKGAGNFLSNGFTPIAIAGVAILALVLLK